MRALFNLFIVVDFRVIDFFVVCFIVLSSKKSKSNKWILKEDFNTVFFIFKIIAHISILFEMKMTKSFTELIIK